MDATGRTSTHAFFRDLGHRKVVQWAIVYVAFAWGLLQGVGFVADAFVWPIAAKQIATLVLALGLPVVVVLAWYHGDRGQQNVTAVELSVLTLLFVAGGLILWQYKHRVEPVVSKEAPAAHLAPGPSRASIAVLPFENRSANQDDAYFVDGIHDDILTQLTKIGAIKVIARTSVERFRGTDLPSREIGSQLGVATVLEGGVQRAGDRVRVTVQLIDTATDAHLWAEAYDRELTAKNIFVIQSEVAEAIARALKVRLSRQEVAQAATIPTQSLEAWEAYHLARQRLASQDAEGATAAAELFRDAIRRDPGFSMAYSGLAESLLAQAHEDSPDKPAQLAEAGRMAAKALQLDDKAADAWSIAGVIAYEQGDAKRAEMNFRRAIELNSNATAAHRWYSALLMDRGQVEAALQEAEAAAGIDPMNNLAYMFEEQGRYKDAASLYRQALKHARDELGEHHPSVALAMSNLAFVLHADGDAVGAIAMLRESIRLSRDNNASGDVVAGRSLGLAFWLAEVGEYVEALRLADEGLSIRKSVFGESDPKYASALTLKAHVLLAMQSAEEASRLAAEARRILAPRVPGSWQLASAMSVEGAALTELGQYQEAERLLLASQQDLQQSPIPELRNAGRERLARLYTAWGRPGEARKYGTPGTD